MRALVTTAPSGSPEEAEELARRFGLVAELRRERLVPELLEAARGAPVLVLGSRRADLFDGGRAFRASTGMGFLRLVRAQKGEADPRNVIAVIGDGAMSAGMAYEAMNNAGALHSRLLVILNDRTADGKDVSWIWDADFEILAERVRRVACAGTRAAELALRFKYAGLPADRIEVVPELERALDRGLELTPPGSELVALPTYTAMLALRGLVARRGFVRQYWERAA